MKAIAGALMGSGLALFHVVAGAEGVPQRQLVIDIKPQPLVDALNEWAQQTGFQLIFPEPDATERLVAPRVKGTYTAQAAMGQLLAGTSLSYEFVNRKTVVVREGSPGAGMPKVMPAVYVLTPGEAESPGRSIPATDGQASQVAEDGSGDLQPKGRGSENAGSLRKASVDEIIVTGTRLERSGQGTAPVTTFSREKLDELGVQTVSDVLKYLPQQPYSRWTGSEAGGAQYAEMRGLGVDTTLVLLNGRRTAPSAPNVHRNAFDLNSIPLAAVERVEVLSDSASALYGADAMGGVINVILKKEIPHPVVELNYGAADGGGDERRVSLSTGYSTERLTTSLVLDYFDRSFLLGAERDRLNNQDFRRFGSRDQRSVNANPGNITSRTPANLPGLSSRFAAIPEGSTGVMTIPDLAATAGQRNMDSIDRYISIVPEAERRSAAGFIEFAFTPNIAAFGELVFTDRRNTSQASPAALSSATVSATNPFNPFGVDVSVNYLFEEIGPRQTVVESDFLRGLVGLRGELGAWDWEVSVLGGEEDTESHVTNTVNAARVNAALAATDPNQALNVFQDGPAGSKELLASLVSTTFNEYSSEGLQGNALARGALFELPAGTVDMAIGGEWRKEEMLYKDFLFVAHDRKVSAAYSEMRVPLLSKAMDVPAIDDLSFTVAARYDNYSDFGSTTNPQYGLSWQATSDLMFRASYGTSFRPPSLFELYAPRTNVPATFPDPRRGNELVSAIVITGGNPDLKPVEGESLTAGFVLSPSQFPGLKFSASYWRVNLDQRVAFFPFEVILATEGRYPERLTRAAPTPADVATGRPGVITSVDISRINFGTLETSGADAAIGCGFEIGKHRFASEMSATFVDRFESVDLPGSAPLDRVGVAHPQGTIPKWKIVGSLAWFIDGVSLGATARYVSSYDDYSPLTRTRNGRVISSQTLLDLQGSLDFDGFTATRSWLSGIKATVGISNLFDEEPQFSEVGVNMGYDASIGDLRGRFGYVRLGKSF